MLPNQSLDLPEDLLLLVWHTAELLGKDFSSYNDGLVYGQLNLTYLRNGIVEATGGYEDYDFENAQLE